jgi:hypothetical protein
MRLEKLMSFYVYRLIDPRDGSPFYIGKGTGKRAWSHEADARAGRIGNQPKHNRIMAVISSSLAISIEIVANFEDERLAYAHEWDLIQNTPDLTNIIGANAKDSEPPPTKDEIRRARLEAKRQQVLRKIDSQYATFIRGQPAHLRQIASEWIADIRENSRELVTTNPEQPALLSMALQAIGSERKGRRRRKLRRKYKPAKLDVKQFIDLPPKL